MTAPGLVLAAFTTMGDWQICHLSAEDYGKKHSKRPS